MSETVDSLITKAEAAASSGDLGTALLMASNLIARFSDNAKVWSLRGYLHAWNHNYREAVADLSRAIELAPNEPKLFFDRGRYHLRQVEYSDALTDFNQGLGLCEESSNSYYRETLLFMRSETLVQLGRAREALDDLAGVREGFTVWTYRLVTKKELVEECLRQM